MSILRRREGGGSKDRLREWWHTPSLPFGLRLSTRGRGAPCDRHLCLQSFPTTPNGDPAAMTP